jgi:succinoglycan biosynthesis protein ExoO
VSPPRISVVIPLYNKGPHIERTLASVLAQKRPPDEIIVIDDGSTDGGYETVQALAIPNLKLHRRSPPGAAGSAARNMGIALAEGDWIALLDADDEWLPTHLLAFTRALSRSKRRDEVVMVVAGYLKRFPGGREERVSLSADLHDAAPEEFDFAALISLWVSSNLSPVSTSGTVLRRQAVIDAGLFPAERCTRGEDKDTWIRVAHRGLTLATGNVSSIYHWDSVNMATKQAHANEVPCIVETIDKLLSERPEAERNLLRKFANREIFAYALATTKSETVKRETWRGFYPNVTPWLRVGLELLSLPAVSNLLRMGIGLRRPTD